jgi:hypothetical protein
MKTKLFITIILIEISSLSILSFLLRMNGLPAKIGVTLIFLQPIFFGLHVFEEFFFPGGYVVWYKSYSPKLVEALTSSYLFRINAIPLVLSVLASLGAFDYMGTYSLGGIRAWMALLSILFVNALFHIQGAILTKKYSPGMVSAIAFYFPLTIISFTYFLKTGAIDIFSAIVCLSIGVLFQPMLDYLKKNILKKDGRI